MRLNHFNSELQPAYHIKKANTPFKIITLMSCNDLVLNPNLVLDQSGGVFPLSIVDSSNLSLVRFR